MIFHDWPLPQVHVLRAFLHSPKSIYAALAMAHDEMQTIKRLDASLLGKHKHRLWFYFAKHDDWVGDQKEAVLESIKPTLETARVVHGKQDIPHAFCISQYRLSLGF